MSTKSKSASWSSERIDARAGFVPKRPEVHAACASCPFRASNEPQWRQFVAKMVAAGWMRMVEIMGGIADISPAESRFRLRSIVGETSGNFPCHGTQHTPDMGWRPPNQWLQCTGATRWWKTGRPVPKGQPR